MEFLIGCHHVFVAVFLALFTHLTSDCGGEIAGPVEVNVPVDLAAIEFSEVDGVLLRYVRIAIQFTNDRAILTLN